MTDRTDRPIWGESTAARLGVAAPDPTAPVTAEGSYEWWRAVLAVRDEELAALRARLAEEIEVSGLLARRAEKAEGEHGVTREREAEQRRRAERAEDALTEAEAEALHWRGGHGDLTRMIQQLIAERDALRRYFDAMTDQRDALKATIAEQAQRTLNAAADKLYALPATDGAALKGPYWYRQGFTQAADLLRDWADYPAALAAPESPAGGRTGVSEDTEAHGGAGEAHATPHDPAKCIPCRSRAQEGSQ